MLLLDLVHQGNGNRGNRTKLATVNLPLGPENSISVEFIRYHDCPLVIDNFCVNHLQVTIIGFPTKVIADAIDHGYYELETSTRHSIEAMRANREIVDFLKDNGEERAAELLRRFFAPDLVKKI